MKRSDTRLFLPTTLLLAFLLGMGCFLDPVPEPADAAVADVLPPAVCTGVEADCDLDPRNGCEVDLSQDPEHCGTCETSCSGGGCNDGKCSASPITILAEQPTPSRLLLDKDHLYFTTGGEVDPVAKVQFGNVLRVGLDGTDLTVIAKDQLGPDGIATDDSYVYWTNAGSGSLARAPKEGGEVVTIVAGQHSPRALAADDQYLYWTSSIDLAVLRAKHDGTEVTALSQGDDPVLSVALTESTVLFGTSAAVFKISKAGGDPEIVANSQRQAVGLVADAETVFWVNQGGTGAEHEGSVQSASLAASQPKEIASAQAGPLAIAVDAQSVYWTNALDGTVKKAPRGGGKVETLAAQQAMPWGLVVTADALYWTCFGSGEIRRLAKNQPE